MLLRRLARPLLATWFVSQGVDAVRGPAVHVAFARPAVDSLATELGSVKRLTDSQLRSIVVAHGALTALAGLGLALGRAPRTAAFVLAGLTLPIAAASLPVRKAGKVPPEVKRERRERFIRSIAFTGAALLAGADYEGRPGVSWRVSNAREQAAARASAVASEAASHAKALTTPR
ncbi:DoxX family membrane protein [Pengzhenrongella frigida]|uniref:DoxX family membrane protein n=1 Tax=Pengzhenrongella frigida TaxID=1259133 RepID=A0A4Q5N0Z7_9MICO|nr:DoxX family membrane protein [Cellulomonas sp. HLT2-17]RYV50187.1 DoxX family membrane protein [Cellulomonas sp. HLT2-17]